MRLDVIGVVLLPYWLMFTLWSASALQAERRKSQDPRLIFFVIAVFITTLLIGLRFQVGGDWGSYQEMYQDIFPLSFSGALTITDPGYAALNWLSAQADLGVVFVNVACAILFMVGFAHLAWRQPNPALAVLVAVPYLIIVVAMGYTRQAAAIGVVCIAMADATERNIAKTVILIGVAALFHKTALLILPVALVPIFRRNVLFGMFGAILFVVLAILLLRDSSDKLLTNYVQSNYDSQGAAIRVAMNVFAAVLFLFLRKRIEMPAFQKSYWFMCSLLSLVSVVALTRGSSSAGVDRLALYLIPLQSITYSRLPYLLSASNRALPSVLFGVVAYCFVVQFVWLNYADNAYYWVPYRLAL